MKYSSPVKLALMLATASLLYSCGGGGGGDAGGNTALVAELKQIEGQLDSTPASSTGSNTARSPIIRHLDLVLTRESPNAQEIQDHFKRRMDKIASELDAPVTAGVRVWNLYSHGFIVKTPTKTFAFDLVSGKCCDWNVSIPNGITDKIDVLFISHSHNDHYDDSVAAAIKAKGKSVVYPKAGQAIPSVTELLSPDDSITIGGLQVLAIDAPHNVPCLMYRVITPEGATILHTGDASYSQSLPQSFPVDVLLLNGWMNEGGSSTNLVGMTAALNRVLPRFLLPGHFEELGHPLPVTETGSGRYTYENGLKVQDDPALPGTTVVLTWGDRIDLALQ